MQCVSWVRDPWWRRYNGSGAFPSAAFVWARIIKRGLQATASDLLCAAKTRTPSSMLWVCVSFPRKLLLFILLLFYIEVKWTGCLSNVSCFNRTRVNDVSAKTHLWRHRRFPIILLRLLWCSLRRKIYLVKFVLSSDWKGYRRKKTCKNQNIIATG